jgi:amidohydrolase
LHQYPELSLQEFETSRRVSHWLENAGLRCAHHLPTGVVAEVGSGDKVIALRADIDALPIEEAVDVPYASRNKGVMHACGHDIHTSVMLGAALLLKRERVRFTGTRAPDLPASGRKFRRRKAAHSGRVLNGISAIFGMHNEPGLPVGTFATRGGPFYANVDRFVVQVAVRGARRASHEGNDAILLASQLVVALQTIASRNVNTLDSVVLSVTRMQGGNTWNVLPEQVELEGTLRTHRSEVREKLKVRVNDIAAGLARAFDAEITVRWFEGPSALVNDERWAAFTRDVADWHGYDTQVAQLHMGGEDFAVYLEHIPGAFVSIGSASEYGLHHPSFNPDEALIEPAARYFALLAEKAPSHNGIKQPGRQLREPVA